MKKTGRRQWKYRRNGDDAFEPLPSGAEVQVSLNAWMWEQVSAAVYFIAEGLAALPSVRRVVKGYRGLAGWKLDSEQCSVGDVLAFVPFTTATADQAMAKAAGATAVFIIEGRTCRDITSFARFAREKMQIYNSGTKFLVTQALPRRQAALLGKGGVQGMGLRQVCNYEACAMFCRQLVSTKLSAGLGDPGEQVMVTQLFAIADLLQRASGHAALAVDAAEDEEVATDDDDDDDDDDTVRRKS